MAKSQAQLFEELCQEFQSKATEIGVSLSVNDARGLLAAPQSAQNPSEDGTSGVVVGDENSTYPFRSGFRSKNEFERVTGNIPIDNFPYGKPEADWPLWSAQFERAVKMATNAHGKDRLSELCLLWLPLKLAEEAQPIYDKCEYKDSNWPLLRSELEVAFDDPAMKRDWVRNMDAYKKPAKMSLQVYRANIISLVNRYTPFIAKDKDAYDMELYNRFVNGLDPDWREYIEESIPYGKESLDSAYSQALKYEAKEDKKDHKERKAEKGMAAAMDSSKGNKMQDLRKQVDSLTAQLASLKQQVDSGTSSFSSESSDSDFETHELKAFKFEPKKSQR